MNIFLRRYALLGEKFDLQTVSVRKSLRVNILKVDVESIVARLRGENVVLTKVPFLSDGFFYEAGFSLGATPEYLQGYYYLQEAASQIPAAILKPVAGELVLDMSAAPGGKTTQLASFMQNKGCLIALDNNNHRLASLRNNLERLGVTNTIVYKKDARFVSDFGLVFDRILLDAPCSGNFFDDPNWFEKKSLEGIKECSKLQRELLKAAVKVLKKGGLLVYSTCTLEPEENEMNVDWLLKKFSELSLEVISVAVGDSGLTSVFGEKLNFKMSKCKRFWPHKTGTQGFFIAKIRKN